MEIMHCFGNMLNKATTHNCFQRKDLYLLDLQQECFTDCMAQDHAVPASSASSEQPSLGKLSRHEEGYNAGFVLQDGQQGIKHHLTCIDAPSLHAGEVKENIHTGAPPPWLTVDGENAVIDSGTGGTSADIQRLSKNQERKLKKLRNPKRVGAAWAERRRAELEKELNGELPSTSVANNSSWLPNFGRVWQAGSRKDSMREFEAEKNCVTKSENLVELQPYVSKRKVLEAVCEETDNLGASCDLFVDVEDIQTIGEENL